MDSIPGLSRLRKKAEFRSKYPNSMWEGLKHGLILLHLRDD